MRISNYYDSGSISRSSVFTQPQAKAVVLDVPRIPASGLLNLR
ncbi:hypothetical protein NOR53_2281 [gamma proteobacterium NOR5-3]|nr:hypothetical protein NOR53_2281 [gamma proteobacterium NOR5-3]